MSGFLSGVMYMGGGGGGGGMGERGRSRKLFQGALHNPRLSAGRPKHRLPIESYRSADIP